MCRTALGGTALAGSETMVRSSAVIGALASMLFLATTTGTVPVGCVRLTKTIPNANMTRKATRARAIPKMKIGVRMLAVPSGLLCPIVAMSMTSPVAALRPPNARRPSARLARRELRVRSRGNELLAARASPRAGHARSEDHTSELQSQSNLVCRLLLDNKDKTTAIESQVHDLAPRFRQP